MEKIWIRYLRLFTPAALILAGAFLCVEAQIEAQESDGAKTVVVDVEVVVKHDDIAGAKQEARKTAFEKALDQVLPEGLEKPAREAALKKAASSIKGYKVIDEKIEGSLLKQKFQCEVAVSAPPPSPAAVTTTETAAPTKRTFEVVWLPDQVQFNAVDLLKYVSEVMGTPATSVRIGRGNIVLTIALKKSLEDTQSQLASFVGKRGMVKLIHRDENRPPDALPAPVPMPEAVPSTEPSVLPLPPADLPAGPVAPVIVAPPVAPTETALPQLPPTSAPVVAEPVPTLPPAEVPPSILPMPTMQP